MIDTKDKKGFTIIEVVLVLGIAALIFLLVFIAVPAMNRGQRDNARKNDVGLVGSAMNNYSNNNNGSYPNTAQLRTFFTSGTSKLSGNSDVNQLEVRTISSGSELTIQQGSNSGHIDYDKIWVYTGASCVGQEGTAYKIKKAGRRQLAMLVRLEGNGSGQVFCQDS